MGESNDKKMITTHSTHRYFHVFYFTLEHYKREIAHILVVVLRYRCFNPSKNRSQATPRKKMKEKETK